MLVWIPDNPEDTVTRLLFPGSTPQHKVLRGLDKLKSLEFIHRPVVRAGSLPKATATTKTATSSSTTTTRKSASSSSRAAAKAEMAAAAAGGEKQTKTHYR